MIRLSIREALECTDEQDSSIPYIYAYVEKNIYFYIGQSLTPFERLRQHIGQGSYSAWPDTIGRLILNNRPDSLDWTMGVWTLEELNKREYDKVTKHNEYRKLADNLERHLIVHMHPCVNALYNVEHTPLPERYRVINTINDGGVKITEE